MHPSKTPSLRVLGMASALLCLCAALALGVTPALALRGHEFGKAFGSAGVGPGQFKEPAGIAASEATHDLYVVDKGNNRVEIFSSAGKFEGQFNGSGTFEFGGSLKSGKAAKAGALLEPNTIAVDNACAQNRLSEATKPRCKEFDPSNGDVYVQDGFEPGHKVVDKFSPEGDFIAELVVPEKPKPEPSLVMSGVAVDPQGHPWIAEEQNAPAFAKFSSSKETAEEVEFEGFVVPTSGGFLLRPGLALDTHGDLFPGTFFGKLAISAISKLSPQGVLLQEAIDQEAAEEGEAASGVAVEIPTNSIYVDNETKIRRFDANQEPPAEQEHLSEGHLTKGSGVAVDAISGDVWVADQGANQVVDFAPEEPKPPTVGRESNAAITADSATLRAEVNPRGAFAEYRFQYGRCTGSCAESGYEASTPVPDGPVGADFEPHEVSAHPQGLQPATTYHFRAVAHNELGETFGEELTFTTQPPGILGSLDGRGYELVSPAQKNGTRIHPILAASPIEAAATGGAITYLTDSPTEAEPAGYTNAVQVLSSRSAGGWSSKDITIPHTVATGASAGSGYEYRFSSEGLAKGVIQPFGAFEPELSPQATEQTPFLRSNYEGGDPTNLCTKGCLTPLVSAANVGEGVAFGEEGLCPSPPLHFLCGPQFLAGTSDLSHIVIESRIGLSGTEGDNGGLYEWSGGSLQLVSILPSGKPASPASGQALGREDTVMRNAISLDGDRVVWSTIHHHLYLRKLAEEETIELDKGLTGEPLFQAANAETTKIFFSEGGGLYLYDTETNERTTLVKAGGGVQGTAAGASEDGAYLYFVANEALAGAAGAVSGTCKEETPTAVESCNLYELDEAGGAWQARVVAVISGEDFADFAGNGAGGLAHLAARVSPDGSHLAFMSQRPLSGYDNRDANSGRRDQEVFLFDAGTGSLACASCNPTGGRPEGVQYAKLEAGLVAGDRVWNPNTWLAANVPGWTPYASATALHQSRYLSNSGRLFFNSSDALSPQDVNGTEDVYEFEPPEVGSCSESSASFSSRSGGCVGLVSSGTSREESAFMDASESGGDIFFLTASTLVAQDTDTALDLYDAHVCTAGSPCITNPEPPGPPCASEASCKAPPTPQPEIFGAPASATFSGAGNITPPTPASKAPTKAQLLTKALSSCRAKHKGSSEKAKKSRKACEAEARRRYGAKAPAKKSSKKKKGKKK
jgi:DNA-binding beta-propeller fold protein YncE